MTESDYEIDAKMELEMHTEISNIQAVPLELAQRGSIGVGPEIEVGMEIGPGGLSSLPFLSSSTCSSAESFCEGKTKEVHELQVHSQLIFTSCLTYLITVILLSRRGICVE